MNPEKTKTKTGESPVTRFLRRWGTIAVIIVTCIGFALSSPYFFTVSNFNNILFSMIVSCLVSVGLTFVVIGGSFDRSVGLTVTTSSTATALLIPVAGPWLAIFGALLVAAARGLTRVPAGSARS